MLEPIQKRRLSQVAMERIKEYIAQRNLQPGDQLPSERQLSEALDISRNSVREALRILEIMGIIEVKPGSGSYVQAPATDVADSLDAWLPKNYETLREHYEIRQLLEPRAASLAAEKATSETVEALQEQISNFAVSAEADDLAGMILADAEFHRILAQATQNRLLSFLMDTISRYLHEGWKGVLPIPGRADNTIREHEHIVQAIEDKDPAAAKRAMEVHLANAVRDLEKAHKPAN